MSALAAMSPRTHAPTARIAVVDDEALVAWTIESHLEAWGYQVVGTFSTGEEALAGISAGSVDVLLMDINLGAGIDGVETARQLRERADVPVIFISGSLDDRMKDRIRRDVPGARLLSKPFPSGALQEEIRSIADR